MSRLALWRVVFADKTGDLLEPVRAPERRFHYGGQPALYACLTEEGPAHSLTRYLRPGDPPRVIARLSLRGGRFFDVERDGFVADRDDAVSRWDLDLETGVRPAAWDLSDRVRASEADGMTYPARLRPELRNIVLFRWNCKGAPSLDLDGAPIPWSATA